MTRGDEEAQRNKERVREREGQTRETSESERASERRDGCTYVCVQEKGTEAAINVHGTTRRAIHGGPLTADPSTIRVLTERLSSTRSERDDDDDVRWRAAGGPLFSKLNSSQTAATAASATAARDGREGGDGVKCAACDVRSRYCSRRSAARRAASRLFGMFRAPCALSPPPALPRVISVFVIVYLAGIY